MKRCKCGDPATVVKGADRMCEVCAAIEAYNNPHPLTPQRRRGFSHLLRKRLNRWLLLNKDLALHPSRPHRRIA